MDAKEIWTSLTRLDTRFHRRLAGDRLFIPDELQALVRAATDDPRLHAVVDAGRAHLHVASDATSAAWQAAYHEYRGGS